MSAHDNTTYLGNGSHLENHSIGYANNEYYNEPEYESEYDSEYDSETESENEQDHIDIDSNSDESDSLSDTSIYEKGITDVKLVKDVSSIPNLDKTLVVDNVNIKNDLIIKSDITNSYMNLCLSNHPYLMLNIKAGSLTGHCCRFSEYFMDFRIHLNHH